jgi:hypothetical protein
MRLTVVLRVAVLAALASPAWSAEPVLAAHGAAASTGAQAGSSGEVTAGAADGTTPLHMAVYRDDVALVKKLIADGANVRAMNTYGSTPMAEAAVVGNVEVIKALLKAVPMWNLRVPMGRPR